MLAFIVNLSLNCATVRVGSIRLLKGSLLLLAVATLEECSQGFFPSRSLSWSDLCANYLGILCFGYAAVWVATHQTTLKPQLPRWLGDILWSSGNPIH